MVKVSIHQEHITTISVYASITEAPKYIKQMLRELIGEEYNSTIISGDFSSTFNHDRTNRNLQGNRSLEQHYKPAKPNNPLYSTHLTRAKCTFFSCAHGTFSRKDNILSH